MVFFVLCQFGGRVVTILFCFVCISGNTCKVYMSRAKSKTVYRTNTFSFQNKQISAMQRRKAFDLFQLPETVVMVFVKHFGGVCILSKAKKED